MFVGKTCTGEYPHTAGVVSRSSLKIRIYFIINSLKDLSGKKKNGTGVVKVEASERYRKSVRQKSAKSQKQEPAIGQP